MRGASVDWRSFGERRVQVGSEREDRPIFVSVHDRRHNGVHVCRGADEEKDDEKERLEVEDCCLGY